MEMLARNFISNAKVRGREQDIERVCVRGRASGEREMASAIK